MMKKMIIKLKPSTQLLLRFRFVFDEISMKFQDESNALHLFVQFGDENNDSVNQMLNMVLDSASKSDQAKVYLFCPE